jgi:predicted DNA-binding transcriptional regulator AlpA
MAAKTALGTARLLDCEPAADYLGLSPITLAMWRGQNRGPRYIKLGRRVKYDLADLDTYLANNKT